MNKIKESFNTITLDDKLKEKTYSLILEKRNKKISYFKSVLIGNFCLVLILIVVINSHLNSNNKLSGDNYNVDTLIESASSTLNITSFTYNGNDYVQSDMIVDLSLLDKDLGSFDSLIVIDKNRDSFNYHLYTIKNNDNILVVSNGNTLCTYEKK